MCNVLDKTSVARLQSRISSRGLFESSREAERPLNAKKAAAQPLSHATAI